MTQQQWETFCRFREELSAQIAVWNAEFGAELLPLQQTAAAGSPLYPIETPVVYNRALDEVSMQDVISLIVVGDNPGKDEQREQNRRYLVGQSGKLADSFFRTHPELHIDFRKNVVILNKTPVHTAKTAGLRDLYRADSPRIHDLLNESQRWMAASTAALHQMLDCKLWIIGYSELKERGIFAPYRAALRDAYRAPDGLAAAWEQVYVFQHFSMNRFSIDLRSFIQAEENAGRHAALEENLAALGKRHREVFE